jgi:TRAP transporter 4TM/12TM fusion protein
MALANTVIAVLLCLFTIAEVNYPLCQSQTDLAVFAMCGLVLCFLNFPMARRWKGKTWSKVLDGCLIILTVLVMGYIITQNEPIFAGLRLAGQKLGDRAGAEQSLDIVVAMTVLVLVLEATRRCMGMALPILALVFVAYALYGVHLPEWMLQHRGYPLARTMAQSGLHAQGVFGQALEVMFKYVMMFVVFGSFLAATGATEFIIEFCRKLFRRSAGAPAKIAIVSSGLMGTLSGSAVANVMACGTFTIPMMKGAGFKPEVAGGIEAAASSGGALMPPVMGAAAYLMLEIISPAPTYLKVCQAALIPAILYYLSLFFFVHFYSRKLTVQGAIKEGEPTGENGAEAVRLEPYKGVLFFGSLAVLVVALILGLSPFRAVTISTVVVVVMSVFRRETRMSIANILEALRASGKDAVPLVCAAACVGIIIAVVQLTGMGNKLPALITKQARGTASPHFASGDIKKLNTLVERIKSGERPVDQFVSKRLSSETREAMEKYRDGDSGADALRQALVNDLNAIVNTSYSIHDAERFAQVKLRPETFQLAAPDAHLDSKDLPRLNRLLLEDAYPRSFARIPNNLFMALVLIMIVSIILGMGLPSVVCYLLLATIVGSVLGKLGVVPLGAHLFIFYFGMMSMVTPPVALAGYAAASVAGTGIMITSWWAFRVALVGFTLPFMFVFRPELMMLAAPGQELTAYMVVYATVIAVLGVLAFSAGLSGFFFSVMTWVERALMFVAAALMLYPGECLFFKTQFFSDHDMYGALLLGALIMFNWKRCHAVPTQQMPRPVAS